ncbi:HoxN/HupN/NixA family nickel/cobalt transporter [Mycobacterium gordonae]|uniref:HoxN/HupN/NixA family nickel/cobalt transporter n=1 Tax=Mycobacterium gordonae TaxID=1778 RepID=UPI0020A321AE|nr:hypothetical protein [Mycobacterium gordonae]
MSEPVSQETARSLAQFRRSLSRADNTSLAGMHGFILLLHLMGFIVLLAFVVPNNYHLGDRPVFTIGVGVLAYTLGLRHVFDADHIAAVDNTTRKLIADNLENSVDRKPLSVGFWFSLGHSTIVFGLAFLLALGVRALVGPVEDEESPLHTITGMIGPSVSGLFLWIIGILNLVALLGIIKVFRELILKQGHYDAAALEKQLDSRGFMNRVLGGLTKSVTQPWHIYNAGPPTSPTDPNTTHTNHVATCSLRASFSPLKYPRFCSD